jgi:GcrA cell cycle regulator
MLRQRTWTPAKTQQLTTLWAAGLSAGQIANRLLVSRSACCGKLHRLGLCRAHKPPTAKPVIVAVPKRPAAPRRPPTRVEYTKKQMYELLAEAVRNTG